MNAPNLQQARIGSRILNIRGQRVMIDADLAELYQVPTRALNQAIKRNPQRFPADFMFQLTGIEKQEVITNCDHLAKLKYSSALPFAFTEHGAIQAANVLASPQAIEMGVYVVRVFVQLRELVMSNKDLVRRLDELEHKTDLLALKQDSFERDTRVQLKQIIDTLRALMAPPATTTHPIGFITHEDPPTKPKSIGRTKRALT